METASDFRDAGVELAPAKLMLKSGMIVGILPSSSPSTTTLTIKIRNGQRRWKVGPITELGLLPYY